MHKRIKFKRNKLTIFIFFTFVFITLIALSSLTIYVRSLSNSKKLVKSLVYNESGSQTTRSV